MNKKIAIIDDEYDILDILQEFLKRSGKFDIFVYSNPLEALSEINAAKFDLILLDIMMPQINGIDFLKEIRKSTDTKVIMMTAYSTQDRVEECQEIGVEDYITKPFISLRDVESKVLDILGLQEQ
jgi:DNA-binding response OmpR family regulator